MPKTRKPKHETNDDKNEITNSEIFKKLEAMEVTIEFISRKFDEIQKENREIKKKH